MGKCHTMAGYSCCFEYVVSFLDLEPDSGEVLNWDYFAFIMKPVSCPRDRGHCTLEYLAINVMPCISSITDGDGILHSWFDGKWASDCREFRGKGEVCVESI